jgi:hypothetical protein
MLRWMLLVAACSQEVGQRCQSDDECVAGAVCVLQVHWECPKQFPHCNACLVGGVCEPLVEEPCTRDDDCGAGRHCEPSGACAHPGKRFCVDDFDLSVPPRD